jgi:hypothetical protein
VVYTLLIGKLNIPNIDIVGMGYVQIGLCALLHGEWLHGGAQLKRCKE